MPNPPDSDSASATPPGPAAVQSKIRLHLSTCLILLFAASALLGANMYPQQRGFDFFQIQETTVYGWPFICRLEIDSWDERLIEWHYDNLFFDLLAAAAILTTIAWLCELRIRR
jgi:hypothetical protein